MSRKKITVIRDTREQIPWSFKGYDDIRIIDRKLDLGDYSIEGYEHIFVIERKYNVNEIFGNLGFKKRKKFTEKMNILAEIKYSYFLVEASFSDLCLGSTFSRLEPNWVLSSLLTFNLKGLDIIFAGQKAEHYAYWLIRKFANKFKI